jgi:hypothetical protein
VQLSALITATSLGSFLRAPDLAITYSAYLENSPNAFGSRILESDRLGGKEIHRTKRLSDLRPQYNAGSMTFP